MRHIWIFGDLLILWHKCHLAEYLEIYPEACFHHIDQEMPMCCQCIYFCVLMHTVWSYSITGALMTSSGITAKLVKALLCSR